MTALLHKGYAASLDIDEETGFIHGFALNSEAVLTFAGASIDEVETAFAKAIADYFEWCCERNVESAQPYSGIIILQFEPELYLRLQEKAAQYEATPTQFIEMRLAKMV